ncbi:MAG: branched-chain amino acid ABC transporter permease [Oscillospiraceae bacterium]|nr:branched-chain amino acid ABC transporter permease [Oscillospiraceae bacterium]
MKKHLKKIITACAVAAIYFIIFALVKSGTLTRHYQSLLVPVGINIILAVSLNLTVGFLGELTLGHAGFMSVGAYAGCLFSVYCDLPVYIEFPLALLIGGVTASIFGIIIGIPALRLRGDYLAIVTLAFGEIIRSVVTNLDFLGGAGGLKGISKYKDTISGFTIVFIVLVLTVIIIRNLVHSRHGRAICSIRDNVIAAESVGINVVFYKLLAFVAAAFFAGVAGVLYGHNLGILKPGTFDFNKSIEILVIVVLGGMGNIVGSIISAIVITLLPEVLRGLDNYRLLIYAVVLIAMMLLNNNPKFNALKDRIRNRGKVQVADGKETE